MTTERRRSSNAFFMGAMIALANASPMNFAGTCTDDAVSQALQDNLPDADPFCSAYVPDAVSTSTVIVTSTVTNGNGVATTTVTSKPTMTIAMAEDFLVTSTVTKSCASSAPDVTATVAAVASAPAASAPAVTAVAVASTTPAAQKVGTTSAAAAPHHGGRDVVLPSYVDSYPPAQVSAQCSCLVASSPVTVTSVAATVSTDAAITATETYTTAVPIMSYERVGATRTAFVTVTAACS